MGPEKGQHTFVLVTFGDCVLSLLLLLQLLAVLPLQPRLSGDVVVVPVVLLDLLQEGRHTVDLLCAALFRGMVRGR